MEFNSLVNKLRTPVEIINIVGAGGLSFASMTEAWGVTKSGKSTFSYQTARYFLDDYGEQAQLLILDAESTDLLRIELAFNLVPGIIINGYGETKENKNGDSRITIASAVEIEKSGFFIEKYMEKCKEENKFLLVIWDSISNSQPKSEKEAREESLKKGIESRAYAGGMMAKPRAMTQTMTPIISRMYQAPVHIIFINQARASMNAYGDRNTRAGAYAFFHNIHYSFYFKYRKNIDPEYFYKRGTFSELKIDKSKHIPTLINLPVFIYDTKGGVIDVEESLLSLASDDNYHFSLLKPAGGWYKVNLENKVFQSERMEKYKSLAGKGYRWSKLKENKEIIAMIKEGMEVLFRDRFMLVDFSYQKLKELGKNSELS